MGTMATYRPTSTGSPASDAYATAWGITTAAVVSRPAGPSAASPAGSGRGGRPSSRSPPASAPDVGGTHCDAREGERASPRQDEPVRWPGLGVHACGAVTGVVRAPCTHLAGWPGPRAPCTHLARWPGLGLRRALGLGAGALGQCAHPPRWPGPSGPHVVRRLVLARAVPGTHLARAFTLAEGRPLVGKRLPARRPEIVVPNFGVGACFGVGA
jgi:hypothetical protein